MGSVQHPVLGAIDPSTPGDWDGTQTFAGRSVRFTLTIDGPEVSVEALTRLFARAEDLGALDKAARQAILGDADGGEEYGAALYISHHLEVLEDDDLQKIFGTADRSQLTPAVFLSHLVLVRIGLCPENEDAPLLLDYSVAPELTDYLLCVSFDARGNVAAVDMES